MSPHTDRRRNAGGAGPTWQVLAGALGSLLLILIGVAWQTQQRVIQLQLDTIQRQQQEHIRLSEVWQTQLEDVRARLNKVEQEYLLSTTLRLDQLHKRLRILERQSLPPLPRPGTLDEE